MTQPQHSTQVGGRDYLVTAIKTALFPANLGELSINPTGLIIPSSLFSPDIRLESNSVTINVQPLPTDAPPNFSGAVGDFEINASLSEIETKVNEPLTLQIDIAGTGNVQTLTEPQLPELPEWRFFESKVSTTTDTDAEQLQGVRTFERLIVPGQPGEQEFPPVNFSYYDPQRQAYQTISTNPIYINVLPDDSVQVPVSIPIDDNDNILPIDQITLDIRHIKPVPFALNIPLDISIIKWGLYLSCWILPLFVVSGIYIVQSRRRRLQEDTAYARDQRAQRQAIKMLREAQQTGVGNEADTAGNALLAYLSDKINKPTVGLTSNDLIKLLQQSHLDADLIQRITTLLHRIDVGRYAPITDSSTLSILVDTRQLINDLEKSLGKRR